MFETIDFRGDLASGFEVELYRNDTLVGSTRDAVNGQYEFRKVPVDFGLNVFRLVFYGPQGQRREDVRRISVGDGRLAKGTHAFNNRQTTVGLSATRKLGALALSFDATYTAPSRSYAFTLRLGFSFGRNPLTGHMFVARPRLSSSGAIAVRAFDDTNGDGEVDPGEDAIGKVAFFTGSQHATSDTQGNALLTGTGDGTRTVVKIDATSLPDIAMAPSRPGVELVSRPGRIPVVQFAIQRLSDIEGTAVYADGAHKRAVAGLVLHLINAKGQRVARVRSENDGFVLMEQIRPGDYTLEIAPDQARRLKIRLVSDPHIHVGHHGKLVRLKIVVAPE